jgi:hypothetical protein
MPLDPIKRCLQDQEVAHQNKCVHPHCGLVPGYKGHVLQVGQDGVLEQRSAFVWWVSQCHDWRRRLALCLQPRKLRINMLRR